MSFKYCEHCGRELACDDFCRCEGAKIAVRAFAERFLGQVTPQPPSTDLDFTDLTPPKERK